MLWVRRALLLSTWPRAQAQELRGRGFAALPHMGLCDPGVTPVSPALAGGFLPTEPPGKPSLFLSWAVDYLILNW